MNPSNQRMMRMLAMVPFLQGHAGIPVDELAREFAVTRRQIVNDLSVLMLTGVGELHGELIDVDLVALDDGFVHIRDAEFMPRPLRLTIREATSLIVALRVLRRSAIGDQVTSIDHALEKLETAVGRSIDPPVEVVIPDGDPAVKDAVIDALSRGRRLTIEYANSSRDELTRRQVDPRRVYLDRGQLYLSAWCLLADDVRTFRLDRIVTARVTDTPVGTDHAIDIENEQLSAPAYEVPAVLRVQPEARWMVDYYDAQVLADDGVVATIRLNGSNIDWLRRLVLGAVGAVAVVEPAELAAAVTASLDVAVARYAEPESY